MTNRWYFDDVLDLINVYGHYIGCNKRTKQITPCLMITCKNCLFYRPGKDCQEIANTWLDKEMEPWVDKEKDVECCTKSLGKEIDTLEKVSDDCPITEKDYKVKEMVKSLDKAFGFRSFSINKLYFDDDGHIFHGWWDHIGTKSYPETRYPLWASWIKKAFDKITKKHEDQCFYEVTTFDGYAHMRYIIVGDEFIVTCEGIT